MWLVFSDQCTQECLHKHKFTHTYTYAMNEARNVSMDQSNYSKNNHREHTFGSRHENDMQKEQRDKNEDETFSVSVGGGETR